VKSDPLQSLYDEIARCNRCGFCQPTCPVYSVVGREGSVARGRITLCRNIIEGRLEMSRDLYKALFECLMCRACTTACFPSIKTDRIMAAGREAYVERFGQPAILRFIFREMLPNPRYMTHLMRFFSLGKRSGLSGLVRVARILGLFGKQLVRADELMDRVPSKFLRDRLDELPLSPPETKQRVGYFVGCAMNFAIPDTAEASIRVLSAAGCEVVPLDNCCCGLPPYAYGDMQAARNLAKLNLDAVNPGDFDAIVTDCGSCSSFLKDYAELLANDAEYSERAKEFSAKVMDFTEVLAKVGPPDMAEGTKVSVTYHDPCHMIRYQNLTEEPRSLIRSVAGVEFREMNEADWCCGGAGSYNISHYELSEKILHRKMGNVEAAGADVLATCCPSCMIQLRFGVRQAGLPVRVMHVSELIVERLSDRARK